MAVPNLQQIVLAVYNALNADATLKAATGDGVIYSGPTVKASASRPYVLIKPPSNLRDVGSKNLNMLEAVIDVLVVSSNYESSLQAEQLADYVIEDLHRTTLSLTTDNHIFSELVGTQAIPSDDELFALQLSFRVVFAATAS